MMYARGQYVRSFGGEVVKIAPVTLPKLNLPPLDVEAIEAEAAEAAARVKTIRLGRDAWEQIAKSGSFTGWTAVGKALAVGRDFALRVTRANRPEGRRYCAEFSAWIEAHGFAGIQKSVRSVAIELAENIDAIEAWRSTLDERARRRLVHPLSNVRRWRASTAHNGKSPPTYGGTLRPHGRASVAASKDCRPIRPRHCGNPWRLKLQFTSASAVTPGGIFLQASGGVGTKEGDLRSPWCFFSSV